MQTLYRCEVHDRPMKYLCLSEDCLWCGPICIHRECILKHTHNLDAKFLHIEDILKEISSRRETNHVKIQLIRKKLQDYLAKAQADLLSLLEEEERNVIICQKVFLQLGELTPELVASIELAKQGEWQKISKGQLLRIHNLLNGKTDKESNDKKIVELEKEIEKRLENHKKYSEQLTQAKEVAKFFNISVFNPRSQIVVRRFDSETTTWTVAQNKIDGLCLTVSQPTRLVGFIQFPITNWPASIRERIVVYPTSSPDTKLYSAEVQLEKVEHEDRQIRITFSTPIELDEGVQYQVQLENIGPQYQSKHGTGAKASPTPFKFLKGSKDNNGTNPTTGQFKAFITLAKL